MSPPPTKRPSPTSPRAASAAPPRLTDPVAALRLVLTVASQPPRWETVCLLLDGDHRPVAGVVVVGRGDVLPVGDTMLLLAADQHPSPRPLSVPDVRAVVLATVRPGEGHRPGRGDRAAWAELCRRFDAAGVDLVDWFLVDGDAVGSLAELTDRPSRWQP